MLIKKSTIYIWGVLRMGHVLGNNGFAFGCGDFIGNIGACYFGDRVTVFNFYWDRFDLGVVDAMFCGDLSAGMAGVSGRCFAGASSGDVMGRCVTDHVDHLLAHLLVLNLLCLDGLCGADILSSGGAGLGDEGLDYAPAHYI